MFPSFSGLCFESEIWSVQLSTGHGELTCLDHFVVLHHVRVQNGSDNSFSCRFVDWDWEIAINQPTIHCFLCRLGNSQLAPFTAPSLRPQTHFFVGVLTSESNLGTFHRRRRGPPRALTPNFPRVSASLASQRLGMRYDFNINNKARPCWQPHHFKGQHVISQRVSKDELAHGHLLSLCQTHFSDTLW